MANGNRVGELKTLQDAATGAADGTALTMTDAVGALFEVSGTFTNLTVNWEGTVDGTNYYALAVAALASTTRARVTAAGPTGSITVKASALLVI